MFHDDCWRRCLNKLVRAGAVSIFLAAIATEKAAANDGVDTVVDVLVQASGAGADLLGLPQITVEDGIVIKLIVRCAASSTTIVECAREQVIAKLPIQLPQEAKPLIDCIVSGTPIEQCASKDLLNSLGLPGPAQQLLACISRTGNLGDCANFAVTGDEKEVLKLISSLKADAQSDAMTELDAAAQGNLRNIISLSKAIDAKDWPQVTFYGGVEFYQAAAVIVLNALLPGLLEPPQGDFLKPIISATILARADALAKVITAATRQPPDPGLASEAILEAYMSESSVVICSVVHAVSNDFAEAVCGPVGKMIHSLAVAGGQITSDVIDAITNPLGIPKDVLDLLNGLLDGKCTPPSQHYANTYALCYHHGVRQLLSKNSAQFDQVVESLNSRCRADYFHCFTFDKTENINHVCDPQTRTFSDHVKQLVLSVNSAANSYKKYLPQFVRELARQQGLAAACDRQSASEKFLEDCAKQVQVQVPLFGDPDNDNCDSGLPMFSTAAQRAACQRAMAQADLDGIFKDVCTPILALTVDASLLGEAVPQVIIEPISPP
jgi:hypothetical protein